jgi:ABC-type branched-subunit amino acid transport system substrate-binding protein
MHKRTPFAAPTRLFVVSTLIALVPFVACTRLTGRGGGGELARADALFDRLVANQAAERFVDAASDAQLLIQNHPSYPRLDEVTFRAGEIAVARERHAEAARYFEMVAEKYPVSEYWPRSLLAAARAQEAIARPEAAADALLRLLEKPLAPELRERATDELRQLVRTRLAAPQLDTLVKKYPGSVLSREVALQVARKEYARGNYETAYELLTEYIYRYPEERDAAEARRLLRAASERRGSPRAGEATPVDPNAVGVVLPVTGAGSLYGRYFEQGVDLAVELRESSSERSVTLFKADSKGTPVGAVKAVRRLVLEDGIVGLVGSVFTVPTVAAAIEANAWGASILSPVVSSDDLLELGPWVFETRVPLAVEVTAVARAAVTELFIERFAVVAPNRGSRRELGVLFGDEVRRLGAEVVAMEYYDEGATDFREQLEAVREAAPDAIFAPGSIDELLLLVPQVKFYDLQVQLLGLSNWNSEKLLRLSRGELEGALFPREVYRGKDPAEYVKFREAMTERGVAEVNPITEAGYFGMRLMLDALGEGASSREEVRAFLETQLRQGAEGRMQEADALPLLRVRSGRVVEFASGSD